jgi:hypothetical protein
MKKIREHINKNTIKDEKLKMKREEIMRIMYGLRVKFTSIFCKHFLDQYWNNLR